MLSALQQGIAFIESRTKYVRAMNIIIVEKGKAYVASVFNQEPDYFQVYWKQTEGTVMVCSAPFPGEGGWQVIPNNTVREFI